MVGRTLLSRAEPGFTMPAFERLAPPPPPEAVVAQLEAATVPGDIVIDLSGRGGWIARAAIDRQRRAISLEASPLTRLLAEVVLRPPDLRHLDAAFSTLGASPRGESSLRLSIGALFLTRCATCERPIVADEFTWSRSRDPSPSAAEPARLRDDSPTGPVGRLPTGSISGWPTSPAGDRSARPADDEFAADAGDLELVRKAYRCTFCRDQRGGMEGRTAAPDDADRARAVADAGLAGMRGWLRERFPAPDGATGLPDALLALHTDRQLVGLGAILERIERDLRAAPVEAALRLAFLHAVLPASRLGAGPGRLPSIRIAGGAVRSPLPDPIRERNPWLAFEEGFRVVRGFVQRIESGGVGPLEARLGVDLRSLGEGAATALVRLSGPGTIAALAADAGPREPGRTPPMPRIRLVLGQPPVRLSQDRLAAAYHGTAWALGREAALLLPIDALAGAAIRTPWSWQAASLRRSLEAVAPLLARDGRAVLLLERGGPEALAAATLGGVAAGYRVATARLAEAEEDGGGFVELVPPGVAPGSGPRARSGRALDRISGGVGDPETVPGPGLFAPPERIDARPYSALEAARTVTDVAVEVLRERGEPARYERLLGEILVGLDRAGHLRRLVTAADAATGRRSEDIAPAGRGGEPPTGTGSPADTGSPFGTRSPADTGWPADTGTAFGTRSPFDPGTPIDDGEPIRRAGPRDTSGGPRDAGGRDHGASRQVPGPGVEGAAAVQRALPPPAPDVVERLLALVGDELRSPDQHRVAEIEPGRWWLTDRRDLEAAAVPLADRVEWATYSLLSTAGPLAEAAFYERIAGLFAGHDLPDETLVRACLESYRSPASTADRLVTGEDVRRRTAEHTDLIARLADGGHGLGLTVWIGRREQGRHLRSGTLGDLLDRRERQAWLPSIARATAADLEDVDCIWYVRGRTAFLFEVEWTAMLGESVIRRHARIPSDDHLVRFLVVASERAALLRHKLEASAVLRSTLESGNWHVILWPHLRTWLATEPLRLDGLEPYLGLEPAVERRGRQLGLFDEPGEPRNDDGPNRAPGSRGAPGAPGALP